MWGFNTGSSVVKERARFVKLALFLLAASLILTSNAAAYSVHFSKGVKNENALRQYLADYDQSRLHGVEVVSFASNMGSVKGLFLIGNRDRNRIVINPAFAWDRWHFNELMDHETAHAICWHRQKDVSHSRCFKQESLAV